MLNDIFKQKPYLRVQSFQLSISLYVIRIISVIEEGNNMSEQYHEEFQPEKLKIPYSDYDDVHGYNEFFAYASTGQKLSVRKGPRLWQRIALAFFSLALWVCILLCFLLAWDYTWSHDMGYTRAILFVVPLLTAPFFIFINVLFNRKR
jgi:hypothetical protein